MFHYAYGLMLKKPYAWAHRNPGVPLVNPPKTDDHWKTFPIEPHQGSRQISKIPPKATKFHFQAWSAASSETQGGRISLPPLQTFFVSNYVCSRRLGWVSCEHELTHEWGHPLLLVSDREGGENKKIKPQHLSQGLSSGRRETLGTRSPTNCIWDGTKLA